MEKIETTQLTTQSSTESISQGSTLFGLFTRVTGVFEDIRILCFANTPSLEDLIQAPLRILVAVSDSAYSLFYITDLILIIGQLFKKIKNPPWIVHTIHSCIIPLALGISIIDSGLHIDKLIRSLDFHSKLEENEIADLNTLLKLLEDDFVTDEKLNAFLRKYSPTKHVYTTATDHLNQITEEHLLETLDGSDIQNKHSSFARGEEKVVEKVEKAFEKIKTHYTKKLLQKKENHILKALQHLNSTEGRELALRVGYWGPEEIQKSIQDLSSGIAQNKLSPKELVKAEKLLETLNIQGQKTKIIHILAITALAITIVSCITALVGCPFLIPLVLFLIGTVLAFSNWTFSCASLPCKGWNLDFKECFPGWLKGLIFATPEPQKGEGLSKNHQVIEQALLEIIENKKSGLSNEEAQYVAMIKKRALLKKLVLSTILGNVKK